ncbi:biliverdin-producing heme oxygenase [Pigmentiphaga aceris]|uniref:Biliverdin-producing heme oxygenase n=1 Tax=Pigmentiphaga aceris TaxID=1940612 RepID=A0A5C0AUV9_9BURK|nr:biliverdin-producing heme oxygenase [Pigmentiphaga aceris]QEI06128.1 biliverdin-producing heme oxygenase [Pigmentiphaga aceris]
MSDVKAEEQVSALEALRAGTSSNHATLDASLDLMRDDYRPEEYLRTLAAFYGFVAAWEAQVLPQAVEAGLSLQAQAGKLRQDLEALGVDADLLPLASGDALPDTHTRAGLYGSSYVMIGSRLGARIIGPRLMKHFNIDENSGCAYFGGDIEATGPAWRLFRQQLEAALQPHEHAVAVAAARATFSRFHQWLVSHGAARAAQPV